MILPNNWWCRLNRTEYVLSLPAAFDHNDAEFTDLYAEYSQPGPQQ